MHTIYMKEHNITGFKYLGYTSQNPFEYSGSGLLWKNHLGVHGNDVTTTILYQSNVKDTIKEMGLFYSEKYDVVNSKEWANLAAEEGQGGNTWDKRGRFISEETKKKMSVAQKNKTLSDTHKENMRKPKTEEHKKKLGASKLGKPRNKKECPHCHKHIADGNYDRWHGDNCKYAS